MLRVPQGVLRVHMKVHGCLELTPSIGRGITFFQGAEKCSSYWARITSTLNLHVG